MWQREANHRVWQAKSITSRSGSRETDNYINTPYKDKEQSLIEAGFDVIVFVPSYDEDGGLITCGNAILSGTEVKVPHKDIAYKV